MRQPTSWSVPSQCSTGSCAAEEPACADRSLPDAAGLQAFAGAAKALSDPTRLGLALALRDGGELCVCDLAFISARQDKLVSHHLRQLKVAGLACSRKDGRMVLYALTGTGHALLDSFTTAAVAPEAVG